MIRIDDIQAVRDRTDIVDLIDGDVPLKKAGKNYQACCPFHDEKTPSFTVTRDKGFYHCFGCGAHGDALDWMQQYHRLTFREALEALAGPAGVTLEQDKTGPAAMPRKAKKVTADLEASLAHELHVLYQAVSARVTSRQIPKDLRVRFPHIPLVPDDPWEREFQAAERLAKGLYALYGARAS